MKVSMDLRNRLTVLSEMENDSIFQILEYEELTGTGDLNTSKSAFYLNRNGVTLKQPRIILENSSVRLQAGALSYMKGEIEINEKTTGIVARGKKFLSNKLIGDNIEKPLFKGNGELFLEPTLGYFILIELEDDEIIVNDEFFYACEDCIEINVEEQDNISSKISGEDGYNELTLSGSGIVLIEIPVTESEIFRCKIYEDTLKIDGEFMVLRSSGVEYSIEKSGTSLIGRNFDGEGYLNVYRGTGEVWLIPTREIYNQLEMDSKN